MDQPLPTDRPGHHTHTEFAPAKVNLTLHVIGTRGDYHLLDGLTVFVDVGDTLTVTEIAGELVDEMVVTGPFAAGLSNTDNSVLTALSRFRQMSDRPVPALSVRLDKRLPLAAGIGGGSADGAAMIRVLVRRFGSPDTLPELLLTIGADTPVCYAATAAKVSGIGDILSRPTHALPPLSLILVNPGVEVATSAIFGALQDKSHRRFDFDLDKQFTSRSFLEALAKGRNDLEPTARRLHPVIDRAIEQIGSTQDCQLARMTGSGATCFGIFPDYAAATTAASDLQQSNPHWWITPARTIELDPTS